jgi:hypothetical protein
MFAQIRRLTVMGIEGKVEGRKEFVLMILVNPR